MSPKGLKDPFEVCCTGPPQLLCTSLWLMFLSHGKTDNQSNYMKEVDQDPSENSLRACFIRLAALLWPRSTLLHLSQSAGKTPLLQHPKAQQEAAW